MSLWLSKKCFSAGGGELTLGARAPSPAERANTRFPKSMTPRLFALRAHGGRGRPRSQYDRLASNRIDFLRLGCRFVVPSLTL